MLEKNSEKLGVLYINYTVAAFSGWNRVAPAFVFVADKSLFWNGLWYLNAVLAGEKVVIETAFFIESIFVSVTFCTSQTGNYHTLCLEGIKH